MSSAPPEKAGSAASLSETGGEFGIAVGVATLGTLGTVVYRSELAGNLPAGVPSGVADAARDSVSAATAAAAQLPGPVGAQLLDAARTAFTSGLTTVAAVGAVLFVALAVACLAVLRESPADATDEVPATQIPEPALAA
jgi:MFS transporter, DHA2 family, multidrug resistance protein